MTVTKIVLMFAIIGGQPEIGSARVYKDMQECLLYKTAHEYEGRVKYQCAEFAKKE
jgi:hypothetical protein